MNKIFFLKIIQWFLIRWYKEYIIEWFYSINFFNRYPLPSTGTIFHIFEQGCKVSNMKEQPQRKENKNKNIEMSACSTKNPRQFWAAGDQNNRWGLSMAQSSSLAGPCQNIYCRAAWVESGDHNRTDRTPSISDVTPVFRSLSGWSWPAFKMGRCWASFSTGKLLAFSVLIDRDAILFDFFQY